MGQGAAMTMQQILRIATSVSLAASAAMGAIGMAPLSASVPAQDTQPRKHQVRDRTSPLLRAMTATQRAHSKLNGTYKSNARLLDEVVSAVIDLAPALSENPLPQTADEALATEVCDVDAAFIGVVDGVTPNPTEDGTFLFTDYDVRVLDVLKSPAQGHMTPPHRVIVTRPGGALLVEKELVRASINTLPLLTMSQRYLFLASYLPQTQTYSAASPKAVLKLEGTKLKSLGPAYAVTRDLDSSGIDAEAALRTVRFQSCR
jgi:hypothetical protein